MTLKNFGIIALKWGIWLNERGSISRAEFILKNLVYLIFTSGNLTYKYVKEIFDWNRMLNQMLFGMPVCFE